MVCAFEQRSTERTDVSWPVSIWNPKATKFYNGRSVNVSKDGALIALPLNAPVCEGQELELNFPRTETLAKDKGGFARIKTARVVRVDRNDTVTAAKIKVGLEFADTIESYADPLELE
jgi:hypothetical protein